MAGKTKADLQKELRVAKSQARSWKGHAKTAQDEHQQAAWDLGMVTRELAEMKQRYAALRQIHDNLMDKHDSFVTNHRTVCEKNNEAQRTLLGKIEERDHELAKRKATNEQLTARLMVCETAMQSMTIHINLLTNKKGK